MKEEQKEFIRKEINQLVRTQEVKEALLEEVDHISPIFCVLKAGPKKWRMVLDLRRLNLGLEDMPVKFEELDTLARIAGKGYWMLTFDLMRGYHYMKMEELSTRKLAFQFEEKYYIFLVLPFGIKLAPAIFTKIVRETIKV